MRHRYLQQPEVSFAQIQASWLHVMWIVAAGLPGNFQVTPASAAPCSGAACESVELLTDTRQPVRQSLRHPRENSQWQRGEHRSCRTAHQHERQLHHGPLAHQLSRTRHRRSDPGWTPSRDIDREKLQHEDAPAATSLVAPATSSRVLTARLPTSIRASLTSLPDTVVSAEVSRVEF